MAISEESRHGLYARLEEVLGREPATTLMEHLPPVGWADVATKRDLDAQGALLRAEMALLEERMSTRFERASADLARMSDELHKDLAAQTRALVFVLMPSALSIAGLAFAVGRR